MAQNPQDTEPVSPRSVPSALAAHSAPETVVQPPTPVTTQPKTSLAAGDGSLFNSALRKAVVPKDLVDTAAPGGPKITADQQPAAAPFGIETESAASLPALPPHLLPHRGSSTPIPRSESHETARKESDDSALLRSPPAFAPPTVSQTSPHLTDLNRSPSPSSADYRPRAGRAQRKETSQHVVRETTSGTHHTTKDGQRIINQYSLGKPLGKGAYASVSLGIDVGTGEHYAVKEFTKSRLQHQALLEEQAKANRARRMRRPRRPGQAVDAEARTLLAQEAAEDIAKDKQAADKDPLALIRREIAVMKKLDHPNLVHLYEAISVPDADSLFLVLEYLPGGVLMPIEVEGDAEEKAKHSKIVKPPFSKEQTREYLRQMILGLEYLHENGIAHRDIKPDNILFSEDRTVVKLVDFGVSEMFTATGDDRIRASGGSPAFLSPESFDSSSRAVHGRAVDVWALGVTLYCMLTGHLPFNHRDPMTLFAAVREAEPVIPEDWHEDLKALVKGMLRKNPEERLDMSAIREHPWVVEWGNNPIMSTEENLFYYGKTFEEPTEEEIHKAITSLRSVFTVVRAVNKMRRVVQARKMTMGSAISESPHESPLDRPTDLARDTGSVDSYTLPGVVTPSALSDDGNPMVLTEEPEEGLDEGLREDTLKPRPTAWAKLRPIKTSLAQKGREQEAERTMTQSPVQVSSPVEFASPVEVSSPVMLAESPIEQVEEHTTLSPAAKGLGLTLSPTTTAPTEHAVVASPTDEHFIVDSPSGSP